MHLSCPSQTTITFFGLFWPFFTTPSPWLTSYLEICCYFITLPPCCKLSLWMTFPIFHFWGSLPLYNFVVEGNTFVGWGKTLSYWCTTCAFQWASMTLRHLITRCASDAVDNFYLKIGKKEGFIDTSFSFQRQNVATMHSI